MRVGDEFEVFFCESNEWNLIYLEIVLMTLLLVKQKEQLVNIVLYHVLFSSGLGQC